MKYSEDIIAILVSTLRNGTILLGMMGQQPSNKLNLNMGSFIKDISEQFDGKGGGSVDYGQGFIKYNKNKVTKLLHIIREDLKKII